MKVFPTNDLNAAPIKPGHGTVRKSYCRATPQSFTTLRAGDSFSKILDVTSHFQIRKAGVYNVFIQGSFNALLSSDVSATQLLSSRVLSRFSTLLVASTQSAVQLDPSPSVASLKRRVADPYVCEGASREIIHTA